MRTGEIQTPFGDTVQGISVKIGSQMPDWKKWELIKKFRAEMEEGNLTVVQTSSLELHGYSETRKRI